MIDAGGCFLFLYFLSPVSSQDGRAVIMNYTYTIQSGKDWLTGRQGGHGGVWYEAINTCMELDRGFEVGYT
jgi:hypothetical protein